MRIGCKSDGGRKKAAAQFVLILQRFMLVARSGNWNTLQNKAANTDLLPWGIFASEYPFFRVFGEYYFLCPEHGEELKYPNTAHRTQLELHKPTCHEPFE